MPKPQTLWIALLCTLGIVLTFPTDEKTTASTKRLQKDCVECAHRFPSALLQNPISDEKLQSEPPKNEKTPPSRHAP